MRKLNLCHSTRNYSGFTMLEVLVAIVILSFGLLGLAGLQATGLKNNNSAYMRTQANLLAYDMIDRMRANQQGVINGNYDELMKTTPSNPNCINSGCTVAEMAKYDAYEWSVKLSELLPAGTGKVIGNGQGSIFTITIMWDEHKTGVSGKNCSGNPKVDLSCFELSTKIS